MRKEISRRGWLAIGAGVVLGMGGAVVAGQITGTASAAASDVKLTREQLLINQRISQAAVRRSNESLQLLDPIRANAKQPQKVLGWRTKDLRDAVITSSKLLDKAVTTAKIADNAVTPAQLSEGLREAQARWARVGADGKATQFAGVAEAKRTGTGQYTVKFDRNISACAVQTSVSSTDTTPPPVGHTLTTWTNAGDPTIVHVRAVDNAPAPADADTPFHITVVC
jgi:hypothetical protein